MGFKGFAVPRPEKVLTMSHSVKLCGNQMNARNNSSVVLQTFIDVTKFSPTALISIILLGLFTSVWSFHRCNFARRNNTNTSVSRFAINILS